MELSFDLEIRRVSGSQTAGLFYNVVNLAANHAVVVGPAHVGVGLGNLAVMYPV